MLLWSHLLVRCSVCCQLHISLPLPRLPDRHRIVLRQHQSDDLRPLWREIFRRPSPTCTIVRVNRGTRRSEGSAERVAVCSSTMLARFVCLRLFFEACVSAMLIRRQGKSDEHWAMRTGSLITPPTIDKEIFMRSKPDWVPSLLGQGQRFQDMPPS